MYACASITFDLILTPPTDTHHTLPFKFLYPCARSYATDVLVAKLKEKYGEAPATVSVREAREAELRDFYSRVDPTKAAAVASLLEGNTFPELLSYLMDRYGAAPDGWARAVAEAEMKASGKKGRSQRSKAKARSKPCSVFFSCKKKARTSSEWRY